MFQGNEREKRGAFFVPVYAGSGHEEGPAHRFHGVEKRLQVIGEHIVRSVRIQPGTHDRLDAERTIEQRTSPANRLDDRTAFRAPARFESRVGVRIGRWTRCRRSRSRERDIVPKSGQDAVIRHEEYIGMRAEQRDMKGHAAGEAKKDHAIPVSDSAGFPPFSRWPARTAS